MSTYARTQVCRVHADCEVAFRTYKPKTEKEALEPCEGAEKFQIVRKGKNVLRVYHLPMKQHNI